MLVFVRESSIAARMTTAPREPPETPEMAKIRLPGDLRSGPSPSSPSRSIKCPITVAVMNAARLAPPPARAPLGRHDPRRRTRRNRSWVGAAIGCPPILHRLGEINLAILGLV